MFNYLLNELIIMAIGYTISISFIYYLYYFYILFILVLYICLVMFIIISILIMFKCHFS